MGPSDVGEVYRQHWGVLLARARFRVDDPDEAQDLGQRGGLLVLERISEGKNELPADPRSFLLGCLPKLARNERERRRRRMQLLAASDPPRVAPAHARSVEARSVCERILWELSPSDARLLRMRYLDDLTTRAIAKRLGTTPGAVRNRLDRTAHWPGLWSGSRVTRASNCSPINDESETG